MSRILHLAEYGYGGGAESVFRDTILELRKNDTGNHHLVACKKRGNEIFHIDYDFGINKDGRLAQIFSLSNYSFLKKILKDCSPEIIHVQNYGNLSPSVLKAICAYKKRNKVKVIQTVHTFEYVCSHFAAFDYRKNRSCLDCAADRYKFKIFYRGCSRLGYVHSWAKGIASLISNYYIQKNVIDRWLTPSEFLKTCMEMGRLKKDRIRVIRNPMSRVFFNLKYKKDIHKHNQFTVTYFGRFSQEKNIEVIIDAFALFLKKSPWARLMLIGNGDQKEHLVTQCKMLAITPSVEIVDFQPFHSLIEILSMAHVSIIASKCFETSSLVINEAVMCGLVPLVANHGAMEETGRIANCTVMFDSNSSSDLAQKLEIVSADYSFFLKKLESAVEVIQTTYNPERYGENLLKVYLENVNYEG